MQICFRRLALFIFIISTCAALSAQDVISTADTTHGKSTNIKRNSRTYKGDYVVSEQPVVQVHTTDSALQKKHNPKIAIALSAVLPGAGQIYNKKYWKLPIVYGCLGVSCYFIYDFSQEMVRYRNEYRYRMTGETALLDPTLTSRSDESVLSMKKSNTRYMEFSIAATGIFYLLNIIDAAVDAHLYYFDISDDLSLHFAPYFQNTFLAAPAHAGVSIALKWK